MGKSIMKQRDLQPERMDDPDLPTEDHLHALQGLARLNRFSRIEPSLFQIIRRFGRRQPNGKLRVLDVASGSGDVPIQWITRAKREGWELDLTMVDNRSTACDEQQRLAAKKGVRANAIQLDYLSSALPGGFDEVTCSLFFHHLKNFEVFQLLQSMQAASSGGLVLCDLERSWMNLQMVRLASRCLTRSPIVHEDALISVRAAFTTGEFGTIASSALSRPFKIERVFPCRFVLTTEELVAKNPTPIMA